MEISVDYVNQPVIKRRQCERMVAYMQRISRMAKKQDLFACQKGTDRDTDDQESMQSVQPDTNTIEEGW